MNRWKRPSDVTSGKWWLDIRPSISRPRRSASILRPCTESANATACDELFSPSRNTVQAAHVLARPTLSRTGGGGRHAGRGVRAVDGRGHSLGGGDRPDFARKLPIGGG